MLPESQIFNFNDLNPIKASGNPPAPLKSFLHYSKMLRDIEKKLSDIDFAPLTVILHILSITILSEVAIATFCLQCVMSFLPLKKPKNLNYFQDNYLIKLQIW